MLFKKIFLGFYLLVIVLVLLFSFFMWLYNKIFVKKYGYEIYQNKSKSRETGMKHDNNFETNLPDEESFFTISDNTGVSKIGNSMEMYTPYTREDLIKLIKSNIYLGNIDVSNIGDMSYLFSDDKRSDFSGIETWDVSNVTDMSFMFSGASNFNHDIGSWNVSNVEYMDLMFAGASSFNQDISSWDVSNVEDMDSMFFGASSFSQDISSWDTSNVETMEDMFVDSPLENNPPAWYK